MKGKKRGRSGGGWSAADHANREGILNKSDKRVTRTAWLSHDTYEKRSSIKLKLNLTKTKRQVDQLRKRLEKWDAVEEKQKKEAQRKAEEEAKQPKKKGRKGPETWKLRGAARPSWEVNEFDTRYVCPHRKAHEDAKVKAQRTQNLLAVYRGKFASAAETECREFLGLLMQLGHLSAEAKQFKSARAAWLECMELEGDVDVLTTAREDLMRMYLQLERYDAAQRLGYEKLPTDDSTWIRFSTAWVSVELQTDSLQDAMVRAIRSNPFCAYYLAFPETFGNVMEYTEEMDESNDVPQSSLEEALEYCTAEVAQQWQANGASKILRNLILGCLQADKSSSLTADDLQWEDRLAKIEKEFEIRQKADSILSEEPDQVVLAEKKTSSSDAGSDSDVDSKQGSFDEDMPLDVSMYAGMFRTAMEMLQESGELRKSPSAYSGAPKKEQ